MIADTARPGDPPGRGGRAGHRIASPQVRRRADRAARGESEEAIINATETDDHKSRPAASPRRPERHPLTRDEERDLAARVAAGDRPARDRLVAANYGLVWTIARGFRGRGLEMDDLVGEGQLGLLRATREFDAGFETRFGAYAAYWIKEAIRQALANTTPTIRVPVWMVRLLTRWQRAERALRAATGEAPSFDEVAAHLGLSDQQKGLVARARLAGRQRRESGGDDGAGTGLLSEVAGHDAGPERRLEDDEDRAVALTLLDRLEGNERAAVAWRHGLEGEALSYAEIGRRLGISGEAARKTEARALGKLRQG